MKTASWITGILGIIIALISFIGRLSGSRSINIQGEHNPVTFLVIGILFVVIGIWLAVMGPQTKK